MVLRRVVKPKNQRVKRALERKEPKLHENDKVAMFIKGGRTSETVSNLLKDLYLLKKPLARMFKRRNIVRPFENANSVEFFSEKNDASLFMFGSHSKKRPHNIVLGRLFDSHILDMIELGIDNFKTMSEFKVSKCATGTKPGLLFAGEPFDNDPEYQRLKSLLIDFFRGPKIDKVRLAGLEHVLMFTAIDGKVYLRSYRILLKKSGSRTPRIELEEMGPSIDFVMRRTHLASDDLYKRARQVPKEAKPKKKKNVSQDVFGTKEGRIHMQRQDYSKLQTRKMKALKKRPIGESASEQPQAKQQKQSEET